MREKDENRLDSELTIELPEEIWVAILAYLDPQSLIRAQFVDRKFSYLANENYPWKVLFRTYFPEEIPHSVPIEFNWKEAFITSYLEHYSDYPSEIKRIIFFIATGNLDQLRETNLTFNNLKENDFILVKTAARLGRQDILDYFYHLSETVRTVPSNEQEQDSQSIDQRLNNLVKEVGQQTDWWVALMIPFYWAVRCNQRDKIILNLPTLLNSPEVITGKTATLLAAEFGHLALLNDLLDYPENSAITEGYNQLSVALTKSGQMRMLHGLDNFIAHHREKTSRVLGAEKEHSAKIVEAAKNLPCRITLAARHGVFSVFKPQVHALYQKLIQAEQTLVAAQQTRASLEEPDHADEALKKEIEATEAYEQIKKEFNSIIKTAMHAAAEQGQKNIIKYALEKQFIDIDDELQTDKSTLLSTAATSHHPKLVEFLLTQKANPQPAMSALCYAVRDLKDERRPQDQAVFTSLSQVGEMLMRAIEERKEPIDLLLLRDIVVTKESTLLERLLVLDVGDINRLCFTGLTLLETAIRENPDFWRDSCITLLLNSGAKVNGRIFKVAIQKKDTKLIHEILSKPGVNAHELVNTAFGYDRMPIICSLPVNSVMHNLLLPYVDLQESIFEMMSKRRPYLGLIRDVLHYNDYILCRPPLDIKKILDFAKESKLTRITKQLEIEVELEKNLKTSPATAAEKLELQVKATGLAKGIAFGLKNESLPKRTDLPEDLRSLKAYIQLVTDRKIRSHLKAIYDCAYKEGFARGRQKSHEREVAEKDSPLPRAEESSLEKEMQIGKRKFNNHAEERGQAEKRKLSTTKRTRLFFSPPHEQREDALKADEGLPVREPYPMIEEQERSRATEQQRFPTWPPVSFEATTTHPTNQDSSEVINPIPDVTETASQYAENRSFANTGYPLRFFPLAEAAAAQFAFTNAPENTPERMETSATTHHSGHQASTRHSFNFNPLPEAASQLPSTHPSTSEGAENPQEKDFDTNRFFI
ncbi:ankyrin repeat domain-containing F-box protein [Legionella maceachernii]|uniref:Ankyrin repeats (3 copies) n=1 Tax=Legionella maceachernii TaxID=466 RepID=A0A0W0W043_9GAMM|nr:ankyrin repeat domain-containing F-box protein [Legionella maceachernii]KTD25740.1 Ankyrin repeats (3 copies) [Legionella maceachernii]SJZ92526.1 Ankyrin repeat-containing protein [Legionella maceachernii]SUP03533.1 Ankyrin repeats (3 copies) [Legionella maceachernii]